jgi:hypothetical protein
MKKRLKKLWLKTLKAYAKRKMKKAQRLEDEAMWLMFEVREKEIKNERLSRDEE